MATPKDMLKTKAETALANHPSTLGNPVSIKNETTPSEHDLKGSSAEQQQPPPPKDSQRKGDGRSLKQVAQESNPSMLGDPVSLKAETSDSEPTDQDRGALRDGQGKKEKRDSKL